MSEEIQPKEDYYGNIGFEQVVFYHLLKLADMSLRLFEVVGSTWQRNVLNYYQGVKSLESLIFPYLGEDYERNAEELRKEAERKYSQINKDKDVFMKPTKYEEMNITIEYSNNLLRLITLKLKEAGLLIPASTEVLVE